MTSPGETPAAWATVRSGTPKPEVPKSPRAASRIFARALRSESCTVGERLLTAQFYRIGNCSAAYDVIYTYLILNSHSTTASPQRLPSAGDAPLPAGRRNRWAPLTVLCVAVLMVNLDNTILNVALPTLVEKLQATTDQLQWIVDAYSMVFGGLLLVAGSLADRFGRKRLFVAGLIVFGSGSLGAAFSGSVDPLIAWRALMGAGAAMTIPSGLSIVNDIFRDPAERARAVGLWGGAVGVGVPGQRPRGRRRPGGDPAAGPRVAERKSPAR